MRNTVHVVYHRADYDGLFSGAVCWHFLTENQYEVEMHGWDFGDPLIEFPKDCGVYLVDLPPDCFKDFVLKRLTWIDHHKSSIEKWDNQHGNPFKGYLIDGVAACRLCWQWFTQRDKSALPRLQEFKDRDVDEPLALTLAGEYDVWDKSDHNAEKFQFGLTAARCRSWSDLKTFLHGPGADGLTEMVCSQGESAMSWQREYAATVCEERGYKVEFGGHVFWCLASVHARNSMWFPQESIPDEAEALMCYRIQGNGKVAVSLYHKPGREDLDLSLAAVLLGGGGHRGACGFSMTINQAIGAGILA